MRMSSRFNGPSVMQHTPFYRHNPDHSLRLPVDELSMYYYHVLLAF